LINWRSLFGCRCSLDWVPVEKKQKKIKIKKIFGNSNSLKQMRGDDILREKKLTGYNCFFPFHQK
jgi:hypothetical protein